MDKRGGDDIINGIKLNYLFIFLLIKTKNKIIRWNKIRIFYFYYINNLLLLYI